MVRCLSLLVLLLFCTLLRAQQLYFYKPEKLKAIPSSETYNIMQDRKGYIWFSTEAGVCRYNGNEIRIFDSSNGLKEKSCYGISEDSKGTLWLITSSNRILKYAGDSLSEADFSMKYGSRFTSRLLLTYLLRPSGDTSLWLCTQQDCFRADVRSGQLEHLEFNDPTVDYFCLKTADAFIPVKNSKRDKLWEEKSGASNKTIKIRLQAGELQKDIFIPYTDFRSPTWRLLTSMDSKGNCFLAFDKVLLKISPDLTFQKYDIPNNILTLYSDKSDGLWIGMLKGGLIYYPDISSSTRLIGNLDEFSVTGICEDAEGGMWCSTLEKGIYYCRSKLVVNYANQRYMDRKAEMLKEISGAIYLASENNALVEIKNAGVTRHMLDLENRDQIHDILRTPEGWIVVGKNFCSHTNPEFKQARLIAMKDRKNVYPGAAQLAKSKSGRVFTVNTGEMDELEGNAVINRIAPLESAGRCICFSNDYGLFVGCKDGLYKADTLTYTLHRIKRLAHGVTRIIETSRKELLVATKGDGIFVIAPDGMYNMKKKLRLPSDVFFDICEDMEG
jgi:ligand-binding sensor domain-containing protein